MGDYTASDIGPVPPSQPVPERFGKRWRRTWNITLLENSKYQGSMESLTQFLQNEGERGLDPIFTDFEVRLRREGPRRFSVEFITDRHALEDDYIFTLPRILRKLEELCGVIGTIHGHDRDLWWPWRSEKKAGKRSVP